MIYCYNIIIFALMDKLGGFHTYLNAQTEEYMISNTDIRYFF